MTRTSAVSFGRYKDRFCLFNARSFFAETSAISYTSIVFESRQMAKDDFDKCESIVSG